MRKSNWRRWTLLAGAALAATIPLSGVPALSADVGCDPARPATVHHAGGATATSDVVRIPCATETGQYTGETTIGVTDEGTVWFSAADWEWALVRSKDLGATWEKFVVPGPQALPGCGPANSAFTCDTSEQGKTNTVADAFLWVDPGTSTIYWTKTYGYAFCASMNMSADDGETWTAVPQWGCPGGDYEKIAGGPAPAGGDQPDGHPHVLYGCTNGPAPTFVVGPSRVCYKSLDGGITWVNGGVPVTPSPEAPGCLHFQEPQKVGPDGTVYLPLGCALDTAAVYLAYSTDEAQTWNYVQVPNEGAPNAGGLFGGVSLAVDEDGVAYLLWTDPDYKVWLTSTPDKGATWNAPVDVTMPGVTAAEPRAQVAAREPGHVAIAYYGFEDDDSVLHGYLTESFDATSPNPTFHSARLNAIDDPLYFPTNGGNLPRNDYLGVTIGPDGTPWTALVKLLDAEPDDEGFIQSTGFAGRFTDAGATGTQGRATGADLEPAPQNSLPTTGGGLALAALGVLGLGLRRRR